MTRVAAKKKIAERKKISNLISTSNNNNNRFSKVEKNYLYTMYKGNEKINSFQREGMKNL